MMKRTLLVSVAAMTLGLGTLSAFGQDAPPEGREGRRPMPRAMQGGMERQLEDLNLTEEQKKQVEPIMADMRQKMRAATEEANQKLNEVLTEEQRTKLREMRERGGGPGGQPMAMLERMQSIAQQLDLTAEQKTQLQEIFAKFRGEFQALREESGGDREAMFQSARPLLQDLRSQVTAVLTPEQTVKLQELLASQGGAGGGSWRDRGDRERPNREGTDRRQKSDRAVKDAAKE